VARGGVGGAAAALAVCVSLACVARAPRSREPGPGARVVSSGPPRVFADDLCGPGSLALVLNTLGDPVTSAELAATLPKAPGGGTLSVDLLIAARQRGYLASLAQGDPPAVGNEVLEGRAAILMLRLLDAPGRRRDVFHYVVVDGFDPSLGLFRLQFGDGRFRWAPLREIDKAWKAGGRALLRVGPGDRGAIERGVELEAKGQLGEARAVYRGVLSADPRSVRAWANLGNVERALGRRALAEEAYREALRLAPADRDALNNLAWLLYEDGSRLHEAEALARAAAGPPGREQPFACDTLGRIQLKQGRCGEASETFARGLSAPGVSARKGLRATLLLGRGESEKACGQVERARRTLREVLRSQPDEGTAREAREALAALPDAP
jgi:tetratricopeptide (TPR) repeat protein